MTLSFVGIGDSAILAEFKHGMPSINMYFLFLARPEEVKVGSRQSRETYGGLK